MRRKGKNTMFRVDDKLKELAEQVSAQVDIQTEKLSRKEIVRKSLDNYGYILLADSMEDAIDAANEIASEHLEILTANPYEVMTKIRNAGAISWASIPRSPWATISPGPTISCPQTARRSSSHR